MTAPDLLANLHSGNWLMEQEFPPLTPVSARELIEDGYCTPQCLLALVEEGSCTCRCKGRGHGLLAQTEVEFDTDGITPSPPMRPAPPITCAGCNRPIRKTGLHLVVGSGRVVGGCCVKNSTRALHARLWPECPKNWHDVYDHSESMGSRAGVASLLGLWGKP